MTLKAEPASSSSAVKNSIERMQFLTKDEKLLLQVGPDLLSVNKLRPYTSWDLF